ncbi:MAG: hypothetical protein K9N09_02870 [Candidatus Cloacimonetes bacterium]|nr:hypothetical protein [Candidatus Cloacimonadota bacterium]MCF7813170.1 hypothetical protein [Candidatus Cloacimonadota bacterium]MCF7867618.1 hypothetical protein [Candidatus Cloacimonadota bacterium]MCF7883107.1 hypothetical protein [Candidatus Cloacimonadota bacterium]
MKPVHILLLFIFVLASCSEIQLQQNYVPVSFETIIEIYPDFTPQKCLYSSTYKTAFVQEKGNNLIHIYKYGKRVNTIGGMGFDQVNFSNLSDITLAPDGSLLALDSFAKKIKKFDDEGKFITEFSLNNFVEPVLFDVALDETFYIYDRSRNEIVSTNLFTSADDFQFGSFQLLKTPSNLILNNNQIIINDKENNVTLIFDNFGQKQTELTGYYQIQRQQKFLLEPYYIQHLQSESRFCISVQKWRKFHQKNGFTILVGKSKILIGKLQYEIR